MYWISYRDNIFTISFAYFYLIWVKHIYSIKFPSREIRTEYFQSFNGGTYFRTFEQAILENTQGEVQLFVSEENSLITLPKDIVGLIRIPAATYTTGVTLSITQRAQSSISPTK